QDVFAGWPFFGPPFFGHAKKGGSPAREGGEKRLGRRPDSTSISAASLECAFALQFAPRAEPGNPSDGQELRPERDRTEVVFALGRCRLFQAGRRRRALLDPAAA